MHSSESRNTAPRRLSNTIASVSSAPIAAIGFALAVYLYEVHRMTSFQVTAPKSFSDSTMGLLVLGVLLVAGVFLDKQSKFRLHRHTAPCFAIAGVFALSLLWTFGAVGLPQSPVWDTVMAVVMRICETLLLLCWGETLLLLSARQAAAVVAAGLVTLGGFNAFSSLLKPDSAGIMVALLPILSTVCLYWFKDRADAMNDALGGGSAAATVYSLDRSLIPGKHRAGRIIAALNFLLPLLCCPVVFGFIHYAWIPAQDGSTASLLIQLSAAVGTMLGGAILYLLVAVFWGRRKLALYNVFTLLFLSLAFALVGFLGSLAPYPYIVVLNIAQKIVFFFIWMAPFLIDSKRSPVTMWCVALGLYQTGKLVATVGHNVLDEPSYVLLVIAFLFVLIVGNVLGIVLDQGKREWDGGVSELSGGGAEAPAASEANAAAPASQPLAASQASSSEEPEGDDAELARACATLAERFHLSRREEDVLVLLARGMVARDIAETLVISNSTAKTHMRNLYAKMDVHSQTELVLMVSQAR